MALTQGTEGLHGAQAADEVWSGYTRNASGVLVAVAGVPQLRKRYWFTNPPAPYIAGDLEVTNTSSASVDVEVKIGATVVATATLTAGQIRVWNLISLAAGAGLTFPDNFYERHGFA